jgi:hypothetical protein
MKVDETSLSTNQDIVIVGFYQSPFQILSVKIKGVQAISNHRFIISHKTDNMQFSFCELYFDIE